MNTDAWMAHRVSNLHERRPKKECLHDHKSVILTFRACETRSRRIFAGITPVKFKILCRVGRCCLCLALAAKNRSGARAFYFQYMCKLYRKRHVYVIYVFIKNVSVNVSKQTIVQCFDTLTDALVNIVIQLLQNKNYWSFIKVFFLTNQCFVYFTIILTFAYYVDRLGDVYSVCLYINT